MGLLGSNPAARSHIELFKVLHQGYVQAQCSFLSAPPTLPPSSSCFLPQLYPSGESSFLFALYSRTSLPLLSSLYPVFLKTQRSFPPLMPINASVLLSANITSTCHLPPPHGYLCTCSHEVRWTAVSSHCLEWRRGQGGAHNAREETPRSHVALPLVFGGAQVRSMLLQSLVPRWSWSPQCRLRQADL